MSCVRWGGTTVCITPTTIERESDGEDEVEGGRNV